MIYAERILELTCHRRLFSFGIQVCNMETKLRIHLSSFFACKESSGI